MSAKTLLLSAAAGLAAFTTSHLVAPSVAHAQSGTAGAIQGVVTDEKGQSLPGVTVIVTSPALGQSQTAITDEKGFYKVDDLPPGLFLVTFYYLDYTIAHPDVTVGIEKSTPVFQRIDTEVAAKKGETIKIDAKAPTIDPTSTTQGITLDKNYLKNIPIPGRSFESALGAAAGSQADALGVSFSGSTSLENQYIVDGVNTTNLTFGTVGSPVVNDFIEEIEVITGGYNAEYGRATGGIANVVTKSGSNEFKGSIFAYWQPGQLTAAAKSTPVNASSVDIVGNQAYIADVGFQLGGPIIKDKLWFFVGFDPQFSRVDYTRTTKSQTDCRKVLPNGTLSDCEKQYADGLADIDPKTGFFITDPLDSSVRSASSKAYSILTKLNYAATPENQGQLSFQALPGSSTNPGLLGPIDQGAATTTSQLTTDVSGKWTSKFNDNKTEVEAIIGWHRDHVENHAINPTYADAPEQLLFDGRTNGNLYVWGKGFQSESAKTLAGCQDGGANDKYALIVNCPMDVAAYDVGGPGSIVDDTEDRRSAKIGITQRVKAAGNHEIKAGIDGEENTDSKARLFSGGGYIQNDVDGGDEVVTRWVELTNATSPNSMDPRFNSTCFTPNPAGTNPATLKFQCSYLGGTVGSPGTQVEGETLNWAAYLRDSWQVMPNLTLNLGIRYEEQRLRYASFLQNTTDVLTGDHLGTNAIVFNNMWAPRLGVLYDWTKEGRSKLYAHWGRFYESIPMDINDRSFGGEVTYQQQFAPTQCAAKADPRIGTQDGTGCVSSQAIAANGNNLIGGLGELIAPGIKPEYLDEFIAGMEYELLDDLKIGVSYQNREFGRIVEDVSTDGANTYIVANPGEWDQSEQDKLQDTINRTDDPAVKAHLQHELQLYEGIRIFDKPTRDYNALQFTLTRRFSKALYVQGSYTYSRTEGNYPGSYDPDNGQVDPNISSEFDLIELLANRNGPLPQDRPHYIKLDGYYTFDFHKAGQLTTGVRFRALSGIPENALASHYLYGPDESFLLPRGELGRGDFDTGLDAHIGFARAISHGMSLELFADIFNVYNSQGTLATDDTYAPEFKLAGAVGPDGTQQPGIRQSANPVSGGSYSDLIWVKTINQNDVETNIPIGRNPNFHNTSQRYAPASARLGVRLTF